MQENIQIKKSIQERILEILDIENITPYKFCKDLGFSQGYLDKRGAIGTDKYLKIIKYLQEYNPMWILNEEPPMMLIDEFADAGIPDEIWEEIASDRKYTIEMQKDKISNLQQKIDQLKKEHEPFVYSQKVAESSKELKYKKQNKTKNL